MRIFLCALCVLVSNIALCSTQAMDLHIKVKGYSDTEIDCLARNIYFEARSQNEYGKYAVAKVVMNRVKSKGFPDTICEVIHQGPRIKNRPRLCQFSWHCDGLPDTIRNFKAYLECRRVAVLALLYPDKDITEGATHYHATYVRPWWAKKLQKTGKFDDHIFYK